MQVTKPKLVSIALNDIQPRVYLHRQCVELKDNGAIELNQKQLEKMLAMMAKEHANANANANVNRNAIESTPKAHTQEKQSGDWMIPWLANSHDTDAKDEHEHAEEEEEEEENEEEEEENEDNEEEEEDDDDDNDDGDGDEDENDGDGGGNSRESSQGNKRAKGSEKAKKQKRNDSIAGDADAIEAIATSEIDNGGTSSPSALGHGEQRYFCVILSYVQYDHSAVPSS
ncbi:hypothetical protein RFI_34077, partial [Reticulomyxa filosa]